MFIQMGFDYDIVKLDNHIDLGRRICTYCKMNSFPSQGGGMKLGIPFYFKINPST